MIFFAVQRIIISQHGRHAKMTVFVSSVTRRGRVIAVPSSTASSALRSTSRTSKEAVAAPRGTARRNAKQQRTVPADPLLVAAAAFAAERGLSDRETEIFLLFTASGQTNKEIAAALGIGYPTVKLYWTRICKKLSCECSVQAAMIFLRDALLKTA
jgi:DNA-binding NarL/FixJ family response regulator